MSGRKSIKREVIEWAVMLGVFGILYVTGLHTEVIGQLQRLVVMTGIMQPSINSEEQPASYEVWLEDLEGERVSMQSMKGETIFLNVWATWCPPCIAEMPDIDALYQEVKDEVVFVMLSRDQDEQKAKDWITKKGYQFPVYFLRGRLPEIYRSQAIPTTYVISPEGYVTVRNAGMAKYNTDSFKEYLTKL
ncbi:MAG: TlpA disulfide reductase family protein [Bacteroidota bacterium]